MRLDNRSITIYATHPTPKGVVAVGFFDDNGDPFERPWTALRNEPVRSYDEEDAPRAKPSNDDPLSWVASVTMDPGGWTKTDPEHPGTIAVFTGAPKPPPEPWGEWVRRIDVTGYVYLFRQHKNGRETQTVTRDSDNLYRWSWYGSASYMSEYNFHDLDSARAACEAYTLDIEGAPAPTEVK